MSFTGLNKFNFIVQVLMRLMFIGDYGGKLKVRQYDNHQKKRKKRKEMISIESAFV